MMKMKKMIFIVAGLLVIGTFQYGIAEEMHAFGNTANMAMGEGLTLAFTADEQSRLRELCAAVDVAAKAFQAAWTASNKLEDLTLQEARNDAGYKAAVDALRACVKALFEKYGRAIMTVQAPSQYTVEEQAKLDSYVAAQKAAAQKFNHAWVAAVHKPEDDRFEAMYNDPEFKGTSAALQAFEDTLEAKYSLYTADEQTQLKALRDAVGQATTKAEAAGVKPEEIGSNADVKTAIDALSPYVIGLEKKYQAVRSMSAHRQYQRLSRAVADFTAAEQDQFVSLQLALRSAAKKVQAAWIAANRKIEDLNLEDMKKNAEVAAALDALHAFMDTLHTKYGNIMKDMNAPASCLGVDNAQRLSYERTLAAAAKKFRDAWIAADHAAGDVVYSQGFFEAMRKDATYAGVQDAMRAFEASQQVKYGIYTAEEQEQLVAYSEAMNKAYEQAMSGGVKPENLESNAAIQAATNVAHAYEAGLQTKYRVLQEFIEQFQYRALMQRLDFAPARASKLASKGSNAGVFGASQGQVLMKKGLPSRAPVGGLTKQAATVTDSAAAAPALGRFVTFDQSATWAKAANKTRALRAAVDDEDEQADEKQKGKKRKNAKTVKRQEKQAKKAAARKQTPKRSTTHKTLTAKKAAKKAAKKEVRAERKAARKAKKDDLDE